jgi:hypothetical protein
MGVNEDGYSDEFDTCLMTGRGRPTMTRLKVIYRTGGFANFKWHETVTFLSRAEAEECQRGIQKGGRAAYIIREAALDVIGLPTAFTGYSEYELEEMDAIE